MHKIICIKGKPMHQKRHRMAGKRIYDPSSTDKKKIQKVILLQNDDRIFYDEAPLRVTIEAFYEMPVSWSKKKRQEHLDSYKVSKPDADNVAKFYLDCMNGLMYKDDAQVVDLTVRKFWVQSDPRVHIILDIA